MPYGALGFNSEGDPMTRKIKDAPKLPAYTGLTVSRKPIPFTPDKLLDALKADEDNRPVFMITPMTIEQRNQADGDTSYVKSQVALWARDNGIKLSDFGDMYQKEKNDKGELDLKCDEGGTPLLKEGRSVESYVAYTSMLEHYADLNLRSEIVRTNIAGIKGAGKELKFVKDEDGFLSKKEFEYFHPKLISELYDKIISISNPNQMMTLGL